MLALLCLWEEELGWRRERVAGHEHQLLNLQQLLDVLPGRNSQVRKRKDNELTKNGEGISDTKFYNGEKFPQPRRDFQTGQV